MKPEWRRFAPVGLYLSLLAVLVTAGLAVVFQEFNLYVQISLGVVVIGLALAALLDPDRARQMLTGRQARYGSNALVLGIAFLGILVVVNYLAYQNSKRWDLTEDQQYTLSPETIATLGSLKEAVTARAFYTQRMSSDSARSLLDQYQFNSKGKFTYQFIDPEANPVAAQQAGITTDGTVVIGLGARQEQIKMVSEEEVTGALVRLISPEARVVYFLSGHGERSPEETTETSYASAQNTLKNKGYTVKTLNLLADKKIPEDAKVVIIAGPKKPVSTDEVNLLNAYLQKGGGVIVMEDPLAVTELGESDPLAETLAKEWGITLGKDMVVDLTSNQASLVAIGAQYGNHAITQKLGGMATVFPTARSVSVGTAPNGISLVKLVLTTDRAWGETDLAAFKEQNPQVAPDLKTDLIGPVPLAAVAEKFDTKSRLVVFGNSEFASNRYYVAYGNGDLFMNAVDWAAGQQNLISLTPKKNTTRLLTPPQKVSMNLILLGTVFVLPGLTLVAGIVAWFQRRRRG